MFDSLRRLRFEDRAAHKIDAWIRDWICPVEKYYIGVFDTHEDVTHNLKCTARIVTENEELSDMLFLCSEVTDGSIILEVFSRWDSEITRFK